MTRAPRAAVLPAALAALVALLAYACGGGDNGGTGGNGGPSTFSVTMGDNFYEPNEFPVKAGQKITINLKNEGAAIHNMRVAGADNKYNNEDDAVSDPENISPGDSGKLEWTAPGKAGVINLRCDIHPTDSTGTIIVE